VATYEALATRLDLNALADLVEMQHVRDSWMHAELFEAERRREMAADQRAQQASPPRKSRGRR